MNYLMHILVLINIYSLLAMSLNLVVGFSGLMSLSHAAFYGIGAYTTSLLMTSAGWGFFPAIFAAVALTSFLSLVAAVPSLRFHGDYFVLAALGFQIIVFAVLNNWVKLTGGPYGIPGIPRPRVFGMEVTTNSQFFVFSCVIVALCGFILWMLINSPFGRVLKAIRDDEVAAASLGKNLFALKLAAFIIAAALASISGGLIATYIRFIDPTGFGLNESIFILAIVIIGGAGSFWGPLIGAILLILLPEALRFVTIPDAVAANLRQIFYGVALIILMRFRPQGLRGEYRFE
jgi:branched-chain amino acid transport system permease protein